MGSLSAPGSRRKKREIVTSVLLIVNALQPRFESVIRLVGGKVGVNQVVGAVALIRARLLLWRSRFGVFATTLTVFIFFIATLRVGGALLKL